MWVEKFLAEQEAKKLTQPPRPKVERRCYERRKTCQAAWLFDPIDRSDYPCTLHDLSIDGASFELETNYALPKQLLIRLDKEEFAINCQIVWRSKKWVGIRFT
ncbi:MAG: PilZ domain-containing protein [Hyphomicrobiales bacterium]